jgi:hypothetical protein
VTRLWCTNKVWHYFIFVACIGVREEKIVGQTKPEEGRHLLDRHKEIKMINKKYGTIL